jgi:ABC-2 type transport system ATP-binding protein
VEQALAGHLIAVGAASELTALEGSPIVGVRAAGRDATALIRSAEPALSSGLTWHRPTLEELLLGYLRVPAAQPNREVMTA